MGDYGYTNCPIGDSYAAQLRTLYFRHRLRSSADPRRGPHRGRHQVQVRRLALAGPSQGVDAAGPLHQEQVRRSAHLKPARPHGRSLPAWVSLNTELDKYMYLHIK